MSKKLSEETKEKIRQAIKKYFENPENRKKTSEANKKAYRDNPKLLQINRDAQKKVWADNPELRKRQAEISKKLWADNPELRKRQAEISKKLWADPELRRKNSEISKKYFENPENRRKTSEANKKAYIDNPERYKKISEANKKAYRDNPKLLQINRDAQKKVWADNPELRKRQAEISKTILRNPEYRLSRGWESDYNKNSEYCEHFDEECREHNREKYGNKCFLCGKPEEENIVGKKIIKLSVHHVDYNKEQGCANWNWDLVPLCNSCHGKTSAGSADARQGYEDMIHRLVYIREKILEYEGFIHHKSL